ncbi:MAG: glycosyltransferase family 1 protein, partial [Candidatus Dadabacteria bacterium]|nr:glycosyltransferase family 1 protein [Candidatus Dadabacteria bacterium]
KSKKIGIKCFYDLPIAFYKTSQSIQEDEAELYPEFSTALKAVKEPQWKLDRKQQEITLADHIFCASSFTKKSLINEGILNENISVIPYGAPTDYYGPET